MKILVLGGGGREHAILTALQRSPHVIEVVCAPGNGGISRMAKCIAVDVADLPSMLRVILEEKPDLVVVGPEVPLAAGIVDALQELGIKAFGPTIRAAELETSKAFAKQFMKRWGIPTAGYAICGSIHEVTEALGLFSEKLVVKADGLAAGKGVVLCESHAGAVAAADEMFSGDLLKFKVEQIVLEEMLSGPEVSYFAISDGCRAVTLATAQDHKRIGEGDTGPNTGGMGAYSTDDLISSELQDWILENVAQRVVDGMNVDGTPFQGVLFVGLMLTPDGPKVLEFNTRFGDPETEAILLRLETDILELFLASVEGRIGEVAIKLRSGASACVVAASGGYPGEFWTGHKIHGLDDVPEGVEVFHAGTRLDGSDLITSGGRVLAVSAAGEDLKAALDKCYAALARISFEGMYFRRDIGWRALEEVSL